MMRTGSPVIFGLAPSTQRPQRRVEIGLRSKLTRKVARLCEARQVQVIPIVIMDR